jgi:hypothetical protein
LLVVCEDDFAHDERADGLEADIFGGKVSAFDTKDGDVFWDCFAWHEGGGDAGAGLHDVEVSLGVVFRVDEAFVFVAPDDEVEEVWEEVLWEEAGFGVSVARIY